MTRWTPTSCRRCGYEHASCTCVGGFVSPPLRIQVPDKCHVLPGRNPNRMHFFVLYDPHELSPTHESSMPMALQTAKDYASMFKGTVYEIVEWGKTAVPYVETVPCLWCAVAFVVAFVPLALMVTFGLVLAHG